MKRFRESVWFSWQGLRLTLVEQKNLRLHLTIALLVVSMGILVHIALVEWYFIIICVGMVISAELFNSAIERVVDLLSPEWNKKAGDIRDASAAAVLVLAITAAIIGCLIVSKHLLPLLRV